jgi:hypothetical protein
LWLENRLAAQVARFSPAERSAPVSSWRHHPVLQDILTHDLKANLGRLDQFFQHTSPRSSIGQLIRTLGLPDMTSTLLHEIKGQQNLLRVQRNDLALSAGSFADPAAQFASIRQHQPVNNLLIQLERTLAQWQAHIAPSLPSAIANALKGFQAYMHPQPAPADAATAPAMAADTNHLQKLDRPHGTTAVLGRFRPGRPLQGSTQTTTRSDTNANMSANPVRPSLQAQIVTKRGPTSQPDASTMASVKPHIRSMRPPTTANDPAASDAPQARAQADLDIAKAAIVFPRVLKGMLLNLADYFNDTLEKNPAQPELLLRMQQLTNELLSHSDHAPLPETKERDIADPMIGLACNLVLKDNRQKAAFKIYYPQKNKTSAKSSHHVALLLKLDRLGAVQVDFKLTRNDLTIAFVVEKDQTKQLLEKQLVVVEALLKNRFDALAMHVELDRQGPSGAAPTMQAVAAETHRVDVRA